MEQALELGRLVQPLLFWYDEHARILPWRKNQDPYRIWVSEIMLQQTRVEAVKPYFDRFMLALPDIQSLAEANETLLLKLWEGLGYYNRVRNLQKAAKIILEKYQGRFPHEFQDILSLPGIGEYTAGAISSISFGYPIPAVDGNVMRVVARILEEYREVTEACFKKEVTEALRGIYPINRCGDFTQALMELGAVICTPAGVPKCEDCPLTFLCKAYKNETQLKLPLKMKKQARKKELKTILILCEEDKVAIRKRQEGGLLGGLWEFPNVEGLLTPQEVSELLLTWGIAIEKVAGEMNSKHIFTHREWHMIGYQVLCLNRNHELDWVSKKTLEEDIPLPTAFKGFCKLL